MRSAPMATPCRSWREPCRARDARPRRSLCARPSARPPIPSPSISHPATTCLPGETRTHVRLLARGRWLPHRERRGGLFVSAGLRDGLDHARVVQDCRRRHRAAGRPGKRGPGQGRNGRGPIQLQGETLTADLRVPTKAKRIGIALPEPVEFARITVHITPADHPDGRSLDRIHNGGFEEGDAGWTVQNRNHMCNVVSERPASGKRSLKVVDNDPKAGSSRLSSRMRATPNGLL